MRNERLEKIVKWLCSLKRPHGGVGERIVSEWLGEIRGSECDKIGNVWIEIGENPTTIFTAHMDTVHQTDGTQTLVVDDRLHLSVSSGTPEPLPTAKKEIKRIKRKESSAVLKSSGGSGILGADDAAGVALMVLMIEAGIPGFYLFTVGEEVGCVGVQAWMKNNMDRLRMFTHAIAFDRRGKNDIITHQRCQRMASDEFAIEFASRLGMDHSPAEGVYTDNAEFGGIVPEIINVSCGYWNEHSVYESLDLDYLGDLANALLTMDWSDLPIVPFEQEDDSFGDLIVTNNADIRDEVADLFLDLCSDIGIQPRNIFAKDIAQSINLAYQRGRNDAYATSWVSRQNTFSTQR